MKFFHNTAKGINVVVYSFIYNISSVGVEGVLSICVLLALPITRFEKVLQLANN